MQELVLFSVLVRRLDDHVLFVIIALELESCLLGEVYQGQLFGRNSMVLISSILDCMADCKG